MDLKTLLLHKIQTVEVKDSMNPPVDIELNLNTQILYILNYESTI